MSCTTKSIDANPTLRAVQIPMEGEACKDGSVPVAIAPSVVVARPYFAATTTVAPATDSVTTRPTYTTSLDKIIRGNGSGLVEMP